MDKIHFKSFNSSRQAKTVGNYKVRNEKWEPREGKKAYELLLPWGCLPVLNIGTLFQKCSKR